MENDPKSRSGESVPKPGSAVEMSEDEKRALELSDEIEHQHGKKREAAAEQAEDLQGDEKS